MVPTNRLRHQHWYAPNARPTPLPNPRPQCPVPRTAGNIPPHPSTAPPPVAQVEYFTGKPITAERERVVRRALVPRISEADRVRRFSPRARRVHGMASDSLTATAMAHIRARSADPGTRYLRSESQVAEATAVAAQRAAADRDLARLLQSHAGGGRVLRGAGGRATPGRPGSPRAGSPRHGSPRHGSPRHGSPRASPTHGGAGGGVGTSKGGNRSPAPPSDAPGTTKQRTGSPERRLPDGQEPALTESTTKLIADQFRAEMVRVGQAEAAAAAAQGGRRGRRGRKARAALAAAGTVDAGAAAPSDTAGSVAMGSVGSEDSAHASKVSLESVSKGPVPLTQVSSGQAHTMAASARFVPQRGGCQWLRSLPPSYHDRERAACG